jgi:hypothetical protein
LVSVFTSSACTALGLAKMAMTPKVARPIVYADLRITLLFWGALKDLFSLYVFAPPLFTILTSKRSL